MTSVFISPELVQGYHKELSSYSPQTQDRKISSLNKFFNWAVKEGHIEANPLSPKPPLIIPDTPQKTSNLVKNTFRFGLLSALVIFIFLLAWRLKIPFDFIPTPAGPSQEVAQVSPFPSASEASPSGLQTTGEKDPFLSQIYQNGVLTLEGLAPALKAIGGLLIQSDYVTISTNDNSDGDITLNPDGSGNLNLLFEGPSGNQVTAQSANLTSGALYYGSIGNNSGSPYLLKLESGSSPTTQFSVGTSGQTFINGNTQIDANLNLTGGGNLQTGGITRLTNSGKLDAIAGFDQYSGNFQVTQGPNDWMAVDKELDGGEGPGTIDSLTLTFSETNPSDYDTLVLKRSGGTSSSYALYIDQGNVLFDENATIQGDLAVNGGDITSTSPTFNISSGNAGTINFVEGGTTMLAIKDQGSYPFLGIAGKSDTGDPTTCSEGDIYYNAFDDSVKICHAGNSWEALDGGGGSSVWSGLLDSITDLTLAHTNFTTTMNWTGTSSLDPWTMNLTNNAASGTQRLLNIIQSLSTGTNSTNALIRLDNADTSASNSTIVDNGILITNSGGITSGVVDAIDASAAEIDNALNAGANFLLLNTTRLFESAGTLTLEDTGGADLLQITDQGTTGRLAVSDSLQVGGLTTADYSRLGTTDTSHIGNLTASHDLLISGDLEIEGVTYLDGGTLANAQGTGAIVLCSAGGAGCVTTSEIENTLSSGSWVVQNTANVGKAALIVSQTKDGDIFSASDSATPKFTIKKDGTVVGNSTVGLKLQAGGTTTGAAGNSSIFFLDSSGTTRGRVETVSSINTTYGDGTDGNIEITTTKNLNTDIISPLRSIPYADGIAYRITAPADSATSLTRYSGSDTLSNGIAAGDEILIINLQGATGDTTDVGNYEFRRVTAISASTITLNSAITKSFDGTTAANQKVVVQRIPNYSNVTISGTGSLTAAGWEGLTTTPTGSAGYYTGIVAFRASGAVTVGSSASITATSIGYNKNSAHNTGDNTTNYQGAGTAGTGSTSTSANGNGGGGGRKEGGGFSTGGGGGGHAAAGTTGGTATGNASVGTGGSAVGSTTLTQMFHGGAGGHGGANSSSTNKGGDGGGIIFMAVNNITVSGTISNNGDTGSAGGASINGGGGGGAGGTVYIAAVDAVLGSSRVSATLGSGGAAGGADDGAGGAGSVGRIRIEYTGTLSGTTSPAATTDTVISSGVQTPSDSTGIYGTLHIGAINTASADVAEHYLSSEALSAGEVVTLDTNNNLYIKRSTSTYDPNLIGIVSTDPGVILGKDEAVADKSYPIALSGRVPVIIAPTSEEIVVGDFLTSSTQPGQAMKATHQGPVIGRALENWKPGDGKNHIMAFVNLGEIEPLISLDNLGEVVVHPSLVQATDIQAPELGQAALVQTKPVFEIRDKLGELYQKINAFSNLLVANLRAGKVETHIISPVPEKDLVIDLANHAKTATESAFGRLIVKGLENKEVVSIDAEGNATFSGELAAKSLNVTDSASISGELRASKIYADEIISPNSREDLEALLAEAQTWAINPSSVSENSAELSATNLLVTDIAAINSLSVTNSFTVGSDLAIEDTRINSISKPLQIQSLALAPIEMMAGMFKISTRGDVEVTGNLYVAGHIRSQGLSIEESTSLDQSGFSKLLSLVDKEGIEVASIDASGSATLSKIIIAGSQPSVSSSFLGTIMETNASAGTAVIPAESREITIKNPKVTDLSLVYVTPVSPTQNKVLYVKSKEEGRFVVGFDEPLTSSVEFNWWIIDIKTDLQP